MKKRLTKQERELAIENNAKILRKFLKRSEFIGIDLGTNGTGIWSDSIKKGFLLTSSQLTSIKRVLEIKCSFTSVINELLKKSKLLFAILEDYAWSGSSVVQIAELGGVVKTTLLDVGVPYLCIAPQTLKKFVLGPNASQKKQYMLVEALSRWGIKFDDDNVCDAFCACKFLEKLHIYIQNEDKVLAWEGQMFNDFILNRGIPEFWRKA